MSRNLKARTTVIFTLLFCGMLFVSSSSAQNISQLTVGITERRSISGDGRQANGGSNFPAVSANGRYVAFASGASNLVVGDTNEFSDIFVHDRVSGETTRVSVASDGTQANYEDELGERFISISADGRYVAFDSWATNLVEEDTNNYCYDYDSLTFENCPDVFVHDRWTGETTLISVANEGTQGNDLSLDPSMSGDGRYVAFHSYADNLVAGDFNDAGDIFLHDRFTGETTLVSVASDGTQANYLSLRPSISASGDYIAFVSAADNLVAGDTNNRYDVFVRNRLIGETIRVSVDSHGTQGNLSSGYLYPIPYFYRPSISADGRFVAFQSGASNLVDGDTAVCWWWEGMHIINYNCSDIFIHDTQTGETTRVSIASDGTELVADSLHQSISADGHYVAFESRPKVVVWEYEFANTLLHDRLTGVTSIISVSSDGIQGNNDSGYPTISANGRFATFNSLADNLVVGDTNNTYDVFIRDREGMIQSYSISGHVTDSDGYPLPGVNISAGYGYHTVTDSQGNYTLTGLQSGTYHIAVSLTGYSFIPLAREISVPPERAGINFTQGYPAFIPTIIR